MLGAGRGGVVALLCSQGWVKGPAVRESEAVELRQRQEGGSAWEAGRQAGMYCEAREQHGHSEGWWCDGGSSSEP